MNENKKYAFEYLIDLLIQWHKNICGEHDTRYEESFTKLKLIKLLFFASAISASNSDYGLLTVFNRFVAMPFGPVESDVYNELNSTIGKYKITDKKLQIVDTSYSPVNDQEIEEKISKAVNLLKEKNKEIIKYSAFELVDLSHQWSCWKVTYEFAQKTGKRSMVIPAKMIIDSDKYYTI